MKHTLDKIKLSLNEMFSNSSDLTIKDIILKSNYKIKGAVITIEGLCSKDELAQSVLNPLMMHDFGTSTPQAALETILTSVSGSCDKRSTAATI